jgi:hypothetical protein
VTEIPTDAKTHAEVAARLLDLAAAASSPAAREQFTLLAALYEKLASSSQRLSEVYLPMDLRGEVPESGQASDRWR